MRLQRQNYILPAAAALLAVCCLFRCGSNAGPSAPDQTAPLSAAETTAVITTVTTVPVTTTCTTTTTATATTVTTTTTAVTTTTTTTAATTTTVTTTTTAATALTTATTVASTAKTEITIGEIPAYTATTVKHSAEPDAHGLTEEDYAFLSDTVFVGDSICSGLRVYKILPDDNVVAKGCVGARNIFDYTFPVRGKEFGVTYSLSLLKPKYVVFSMGMNDINMTTAEKYCENYDNLMKTIHTVLPDSRFFVASITPIAADCKFSTNAKIETFNSTMKEHLANSDYTYVNIAEGLKIWDGSLRTSYSGGDGIHLAPDAYYVLLNGLCDNLVDSKIVGGWKNGVAYGWAKKN